MNTWSRIAAAAAVCLGCVRLDLRAAQPPCEIADIAWTMGPDHPEPRKGGCLTARNGKIISAFGMRYPWGEMATTYIFDPNTQTWSPGPDGPLGQTYLEGTECGDLFYAVGGRSAAVGGVHPLCFALHDQQGSNWWTQVADLNQARAFAPSAAVGSKLFVFGGATTTTGPTIASVEMLDTAQSGSAWQTVSALPAGTRGWLSAATVKGKIYLIGGAHIETQVQRTNDLWMFDPSSGEWRQKQSLPYRVSGTDCCVYLDRYIILLGGAAMTEDYTSEMMDVWRSDPFYASYYCPFVLVYDTSIDHWYRLPSLLPRPTNDIRVVLVDDKVYALGGENIDPNTSNTTAWLRVGQIRLQQKLVLFQDDFETAAGVTPYTIQQQTNNPALITDSDPGTALAGTWFTYPRESPDGLIGVQVTSSLDSTFTGQYQGSNILRILRTPVGAGSATSADFTREQAGGVIQARWKMMLHPAADYEAMIHVCGQPHPGSEGFNDARITLSIFGDGSVHYYQAAWNLLPGISALPQKWQTYQLDLDLDQQQWTLAIDGSKAGAVSGWGNVPGSNVGSIVFRGGGAWDGDPGDLFYIDDLQVYPAVLDVSRDGEQLVLAWKVTGYVLQQTDTLSNPVSWTNVANGDKSPVAIPVFEARKFYRLKK